jgi:hypothetical protein
MILEQFSVWREDWLGKMKNRFTQSAILRLRHHAKY